MRQISPDWWISVDDRYRSRVDDGSLVLWRPERTIWINVWNDAADLSPKERLRRWVKDRDDHAVDLFHHDDGPLIRFAYALAEPEAEGGQRLAVYSFTVAPTATVQMACYFDLELDQPWAEAVTRSLSYGEPDPEREVVDPVGEHGHLVMASTRVIGPEKHPILLAVRVAPANDDDSGWQLFHGDEDAAFLADPGNAVLCPVSSILGVDPSIREILNMPAGTAWRRTEVGQPWNSETSATEAD
ncbi:MAG: DUF2185 domain-containing protein [Isosphaeraceae bacterium]